MKIELFEKNSSFDDKNSDLDFHIWKYLETSLHAHKDYYELFLVTKGPIQYLINGEMMTLKTMDMSIVRPSDKHRFFPSKNDKSIQHLNLAVDCDYFNYFDSFLSPNLKEKRGQRQRLYPHSFIGRTVSIPQSLKKAYQHHSYG